MPNVGDTGNGATFVAGTTAVTLAVQKIKIGKYEIDALDVSLLATTDFSLVIASDLKKPVTVTLEGVFSTSVNAPVLGSAPETGTVTFPQRTGESAAATLAGTGFWKSWEIGELANGTIQTVTAEFQFDGDTGPAFTKATTS